SQHWHTAITETSTLSLPDALPIFLALGVAYRDNALENPHFYRVMFSPDTTGAGSAETELRPAGVHNPTFAVLRDAVARATGWPEDRKSTRLNSSHVKIAYAVFCLK